MFLSLSTHWHYLWLVTASAIAGIMNAVAGGGSFVSFPAMLAMGVLPIQANATNTVALWPGQLTSLVTLRSDMRRDLLPVVATASVLGGVGGAILLLRMPELSFLHQIPWLLLAGSLLFGISGPVSRWLRARAAGGEDDVRRDADVDADLDAGRVGLPRVSKPRRLPLLLIFVAILPVTFYIGYFGAGAGFLIMTALSLCGVEEMHTLNAMKILAACLANLCAIFTFIARGAILWHYCLLAMIFAAAGGYLGARYARRADPGVLRAVVVITGCVVAGYFFWRQA